MLARSLAVQALMSGHKAAVLDADPQGTVVQWSRRREARAPLVMALGGQSIGAALAEIERRGGEYVVIDTPPHAQPIINAAAEAAQMALIVTGPYPEDLEQVAVVARILETIGHPAGIVLNKTPSKAQALTLARSALTAFKMPTCPVAVTQLVGHPYASAEGMTVQEREPGGKGATEIAGVWAWLNHAVAPSHLTTVTR